MAKPKPTKKEEDVTGDDWVARSVRMPRETYDRIVADAKANRRSVNLHILWLLERALDVTAE